ncbi:MAG: hypothetical protein JST86_03370 [Bacteroidetes bacterium]|nr:hypothetical protein [Bacteroidota bacterium]
MLLTRYSVYCQQSSKDTGRVSKAEIFTSGFIDIVNNGEINASARFIRLFIGEPGKFAIPLSFYGGVSNNNFQNQSFAGGLQKSNDHLINQYINPLSGLINISIDGISYFKSRQKITKAGILYHIGERILTGYKVGLLTDPKTGQPTNFLNSFSSAGFCFQTGAWERNNSGNIGLFWLATRYHLCYSNPAQIMRFLPDISTNGIYHGYSFGFGIEINNLVNIKAICYKYIKPPEIEYSFPVYQFSFNYTFKN